MPPGAGSLSYMASAQQTAELWDDAVAQRVVAHVAAAAAGRRPAARSCAPRGSRPSGLIHLGNLREVFTTHLVAEALRRHGHEVVHLHSWDDYDRFRKVPAGVDSVVRAVRREAAGVDPRSAWRISRPTRTATWTSSAQSSRCSGSG